MGQQIFQLAVIALLGIGLSSCGGAKEPCDYEVEEFKAKVKEVTTIDGELDVILDFKRTELAYEDQRLSKLLKKDKIDSGYLAQYWIIPGSIYSGTYSKRISGDSDCEEFFVSFDQALK